MEEEVKDHPLTLKILSQLAPPGLNCRVIAIHDYRDVFNPKGQNFRIQKQNPALILAKKTGKLVHRSPSGFGIGSQNNFYFSTMLNCPFDCRYCFLQGMFESANYVLFVNYEDFFDSIKQTASEFDDSYFFSGYDADSLAFENYSHFAKEALAAFEKMPGATLELRTKSIQIGPLLSRAPLSNVIVAFTATPEEVSKNIEHLTPPFLLRLKAMAKLAKAGWKIGIRLDPLIYDPDFINLYTALITSIFEKVPREQLHSFSVGPLRFPQKMHKKISDLYPNDPLIHFGLIRRDGLVTYEQDLEEKMNGFVKNLIKAFHPQGQIFSCLSQNP